MNSGIYEIVNSLNGKRYIGSAVNLRKRWWEHHKHLRTGSHVNQHLQAAWNKYGSSAFVFAPIFLCDKSDLVPWEQRYLDEFHPEYNKCPTAGSMLGYKHSPEYRAKASELLRGNTRASGNKGKHKSEGHREKIAAALSGNKNALGVSRPDNIPRMLGNTFALGHKQSAELRMIRAERMKGKRYAAGYKHTTEQNAEKSKRQTGRHWSEKRRAAQLARKA